MSNLTTEQLNLLNAAEQAAQHSYSPYSNFAVGAAITWADGATTTGTNVENLSYGLTLCAERAAVVSGVGRGARKIQRVAIWVAAEQIANPCGACLQVLNEFADATTEVVLGGIAHSPKVCKLADFLPNPFQADLA